jgi:hypothetical protein
MTNGPACNLKGFGWSRSNFARRSPYGENRAETQQILDVPGAVSHKPDRAAALGKPRPLPSNLPVEGFFRAHSGKNRQ